MSDWGWGGPSSGDEHAWETALLRRLVHTRWVVITAGLLAVYGCVFAAVVALNGQVIDLPAAVRIPVSAVGVLGVIVAVAGVLVAVFWRGDDVGAVLLMGAIVAVIALPAYVYTAVTGDDLFGPQQRGTTPDRSIPDISFADPPTGFPRDCGPPSPSYSNLVVVITKGRPGTQCGEVTFGAIQYAQGFSDISGWNCRKVRARVARCSRSADHPGIVFEIRSR